MKKLMSVLLICCMMLGLTACGGEEEKKDVLTCSTTQNGAEITMKFDAKGDEITRIKQTSSFEVGELAEDQMTALDELVKTAKETYDAIEGTEYSSEIKDGKLVESIIINTNEDTLKEVMEQELLPVTGGSNVTKLSLKETKKGLESAGWTVEE